MIDDNEIQHLPDRIYDNFIQATFFVTGGTGYMGKTIIERLLRVFDVKKVYVLIRFKKDKSPEVRLHEIFANPLFKKVRDLRGDQILEKCVVIAGDITKAKLGISEEDYETLKKEVEYVIHSAATVRFDEPYKSAVLINTKGTFSMLQLAKEMQKLKCFVHVSTTFCHPEEEVLEEKVYRSKHQPERYIEIADWFDDKTIAGMTKTLLEDVPNSYTFSKALAEDLVTDAMDTIPAIIERLSIVVPMWGEPLPGWFDNINGPVGAMVAAGKGVLRTMYGQKEIIADFISVDGAADITLIFCAYSMINRFSTRVYNVCTGKEVGMSWKDMYETGKSVAVKKVPFDIVLWRPGGKMTNCKFMHYFKLVLTQLIPALLIDAIVPLFGYKRFLWRIQMRIIHGTNVLNCYTTREWIFRNDNVLNIRKWLNPKELSRYTVDYSNLDTFDYMTNAIYCVRRYLLKEPDENLSMARRRMKIMVYLDKISVILLKILLAYIFYKWILLPILNYL